MATHEHAQKPTAAPSPKQPVAKQEGLAGVEVVLEQAIGRGLTHHALYQDALTTYIHMVLQLRDQYANDMAVPQSLIQATLSEAQTSP